MKTKIIGIFVMTLLITTAVLPAVGTVNIDDYKISVITEKKYQYPEKSISSSNLVTPILLDNIHAPKAKEEKEILLKTKDGKKRLQNVKPASIIGDIPVATTPEDEFHPTLAMDNSGWLFGAHTLELDVLDTSVVYTFSEDSGTTWENTDIKDVWAIEGVLDYPAVDYWGSGNKFIGTFQPDPNDHDGAAEYLLRVDDPTDIETWDLGYYDWSADYSQSNRQSPDIAGYSDVGDHTWFYGVMATVVDSDYSGGGYLPGEGIPCLCFPNYNVEDSEWNWWFNWEGAIHEDCAHSCIDIDRSNGMVYGAWDWYNESAPEKGRDIFLATADVHDWWVENWVINWYTLGGSEENTFPDIAADNGHVYIVYQDDSASPGKHDLTCLYSHDGGETWNISTISADPAKDELYPAITSVGLEATCTFIKDGNLYYSKTTDGGQTWSTPEQVNDEDGNVESEFRNHDITTDGTIVWTDNRNDNLDVFLDNIGGAVPIIDIISVTGGFFTGVKAVIKNIGTVTASSVDWTIKVTGGILNLINVNKGGTISDLAPDESQKVGTGLFFGLGKIAITITADGDIENKNGFHLIVYTIVN